MRVQILKVLDVYLPQNVRTCVNHSEFDAWQNVVADTEAARFTTFFYEYDQGKIEDMLHLLKTEPIVDKKSVVNQGGFYIAKIIYRNAFRSLQ